MLFFVGSEDLKLQHQRESEILAGEIKSLGFVGLLKCVLCAVRHISLR